MTAKTFFKITFFFLKVLVLEVQGHLFLSKLCSLQCSLTDSQSGQSNVIH